MKQLALVAALAAGLAAAPSSAATVAVYSAPVTPAPNQSFGGTLGLNFDASSAFTVTALGAYDGEGNGFSTNVTVGIIDRNTGLLVSPTVNFNGVANPGGAAYVFQSVTAFTLGAGNYQLAAWNYNGTDQNFNDGFSGTNPIVFNGIGGKLTALDAAYSFTPGALGTNFDPGLTRYGAGSFLAAIPEPATWGLMIAGFGMVGFAARRRRVVAA